MKNFRNHLMESNREKYYQDLIEEWKDTSYIDSPIAVGWLDGRQNQTKRFETLLDIGVQEGDSILDLGCGKGRHIHKLYYYKGSNVLNSCY